ncbi:hypothetical protein Tco_0164251 [Tanacetum coccineum]
MVAVSNRENSVTLLTFTIKKKIGKSLIVTPTLPSHKALRLQGHYLKEPVDKGFPSIVYDEGTVKTKPLPKGPHGDKESKGFKPPTDMELFNHLSLLFSDEELIKESEKDVFEVRDEMDEDIYHTNEEETQSLSPTKNSLNHLTHKILNQTLTLLALYTRLTKDQWEKHKEAAASYADLKSEIKGFHDGAYKVHRGSLKVIQDAVKEDPALNKKFLEATEAYTENSINLTKLL